MNEIPLYIFFLLICSLMQCSLEKKETKLIVPRNNLDHPLSGDWVLKISIEPSVIVGSTFEIDRKGDFSIFSLDDRICKGRFIRKYEKYYLYAFDITIDELPAYFVKFELKDDSQIWSSAKKETELEALNSDPNVLFAVRE